MTIAIEWVMSASMHAVVNHDSRELVLSLSPLGAGRWGLSASFANVDACDLIAAIADGQARVHTESIGVFPDLGAAVQAAQEYADRWAKREAAPVRLLRVVRDDDA